jgi:predicted house-cleaning noncanonical NTP pyrophosphatase (MazG superfamily)
MKYIKFRTIKLVRDKITTIFKNDGINCEYEVMNQEEF